MGYRSEVGLCLSGQAQAKLEARLLRLAIGRSNSKAVKTAKGIRELLKAADLKKHEASGTTAYYWFSREWFLVYPDVSFIDSFLEELNEEAYLFIRLGESDDDTVVKGAFWDNPLQMSIVRRITFD